MRSNQTLDLMPWMNHARRRILAFAGYGITVAVASLVADGSLDASPIFASIAPVFNSACDWVYVLSALAMVVAGSLYASTYMYIDWWAKRWVRSHM